MSSTRTDQISAGAIDAESATRGNGPYLQDAGKVLGLVPMVAEYINDFIDPKGRMVYIVETCYIPDPEYSNIEDRPSRFQSTVLSAFSTVEEARACMRQEMEVLFFANASIDQDSPTWSDFYWCEGTDEEKESAIQALRDGQEGAEEKFYFPWTEGSDSPLLIHACCGRLCYVSIHGSDDDDDDDDGMSWCCSEDSGYTLVIRAVQVETIDRAALPATASTGQDMQAVKKASGNHIDGLAGHGSSDLGLMPMVAQLINTFIDSQGRMVYIVETTFVPDQENTWDYWDDIPTEFHSTFVCAFNTVAAARACLREVMEAEIRRMNKVPRRYKNDPAWPWTAFYSYGGTDEEETSDIQSLLCGNDGAEGKFDFPWTESSDSARLFFASCGHLAVQDHDEVDEDHDEADEDCGWGYTFVIRAVLVK